MDGQVLTGVESFDDVVRVLVTIERRDRLAHAEVTGRPRVWPGEMAREEPVRSPLPHAAHRGDARHDPAAGPAHGDGPRLDLVAGQPGKSVEVEIRPREADHVLGLAPGEAERE